MYPTRFQNRRLSLLKKTPEVTYFTRFQARKLAQLQTDANYVRSKLTRFERSRGTHEHLQVACDLFGYLATHPLLLEKPHFRAAVLIKIQYLYRVAKETRQNALDVFDSHHFHFMTEERQQYEQAMQTADKLEEVLQQVECICSQ